MVYNLTLGSKTNEDLNFYLRNSPREALPEALSKTSETGNRPGKHDYGADYGPLTISLECTFERTGNEELLQEDIRALTDHLTNVDGEPRELELTFAEEPDLSYLVRYDGGGLGVGRGLAEDQGDFTLELVAVDPRARQAENTVSFTITSSPQNMEVENAGNVRTPVIMEITNEGGSTIPAFQLEKLG